MGDIFKWTGTQWTKVYAVLLTDLLLLIEKEDDSRWHVVHEPIYLRDISGLEAQRKFCKYLIYFIYMVMVNLEIEMCSFHVNFFNSNP